MKDMGVKMMWIVPNILLHLLAIGVLWFIVVNAETLQEIGYLVIWTIGLLLLLLINFFGSYQIASWIKQGKM
ncbi:hypothetical protein BHE17_12280 [Planococcus maritimus]|uniref:hypothetical protein n=1 Tax=Planococcus maritimus TaxID=192421 RepID=UPI00084CC308|nr:hypothetical protein [Planococcus maritimus]OED33187.1 hypothetical protein BHE17_12280 [Planococcus maritimus]